MVKKWPRNLSTVENIIRKTVFLNLFNRSYLVPHFSQKLKFWLLGLKYLAFHMTYQTNCNYSSILIYCQCFHIFRNKKKIFLRPILGNFKKISQKSEKNMVKMEQFSCKILLNNFGFWYFSHSIHHLNI